MPTRMRLLGTFLAATPLVAEGRWKAIIDSLHAGDYVFIRFGHNDEKVGTNNYSSLVQQLSARP